MRGKQRIRYTLRWFFAPGRLLRANSFMLRNLFPCLAITALLLVATYIINLSYPKYFSALLVYTGKELDCILRSQLQRLKQNRPEDIIILGDSSGLMGINPQQLSRATKLDVAGYCTIAYAGPASYADMLDYIVSRGQRPQKVILALHPAEFDRQQDWEQWTVFVHEQLFMGDHNILIPKRPQAARQLIQANLVYSPMPRAFGLYYGSLRNLSDAIYETAGSAVDPTNPLPFYTNIHRPVISPLSFNQAHEKFLAPEENEEKTLPPPLAFLRRQSASMLYSPTQRYYDALVPLKDAIERYGKKDVVIVWTPMIIRTKEQFNDVVSTIKETHRILDLDINSSAICDYLFALPQELFSSSTHLNILGREMFTEALSKKIPEFLSVNESR